MVVQGRGLECGRGFGPPPAPLHGGPGDSTPCRNESGGRQPLGEAKTYDPASIRLELRPKSGQNLVRKPALRPQLGGRDLVLRGLKDAQEGITGRDALMIF